MHYVRAVETSQRVVVEAVRLEGSVPNRRSFIVLGEVEEKTVRWGYSRLDFLFNSLIKFLI